jgi:hypothetical protein
VSIPLFPERPTRSAVIVPLKDPYENAIPPDIICMMIKETLERWDRDWEKIVTCHYPDHNGSHSVWDNHFVGRPT